MDAIISSRASLWLPHSPFRRPDGRWLRSGHLAATGHRSRPEIDDAWVECALQIRTASCHDERQRRHEHPDSDIMAALDFSKSNSSTVWELKARLLTDQPLADVASIMGLPTATVEAFEALFFAVRDHLHARLWIATQVLGPGLWHGFARSEPGKIWMTLAYWGGPSVLDVVLAVARDRPLPPYVLPAAKSDRGGAEADIRFAVKLLMATMTDQTDETWRLLLLLAEDARAIDGRAKIPPEEWALKTLLAVSARSRKARARSRKKAPKTPAPAPQPTPADRQRDLDQVSAN